MRMKFAHAGELQEYVTEEVNVRRLTPCSDALQYCSLRAEPDNAVLGKRLGKVRSLRARFCAQGCSGSMPPIVRKARLQSCAQQSPLGRCADIELRHSMVLYQN